MAGKRKNPDYHQLCVYVPKELAVKFKTFCTAQQVEQSEIVTEFIKEWVSEQEKINNK